MAAIQSGDFVDYIDHDHRVYKYTVYKVLDHGDTLEIRHKGKKFYLIKNNEIKEWTKTPAVKCLT